ncbi:DUF3667 domain-containing protein [Flavobacterium hauense]
MPHTCHNCGNIFEGNFCNNCGQPAHLHPINAKYIWHDVQHGLFHFDYGIFYTLWQLLIRPGHTVREYIQGKRIAHFAPVSLVLIMATLYGFIYHLFDINTFRYSTSEEVNYNNVNEWLGHHFSLFTLVTIPYYAFFSWLFFIRRGYNFSEHIVLNCFLASQRLCISILAIPFLYYAKSKEEIAIITGILTLIYLFLAYRGFSQFFNTIPKWKALLLTTLCYIVSIMVMSICAALILIEVKPAAVQ